jgi:hypothetical protein
MIKNKINQERNQPTTTYCSLYTGLNTIQGSANVFKTYYEFYLIKQRNLREGQNSVPGHFVSSTGVFTALVLGVVDGAAGLLDEKRRVTCNGLIGLDLNIDLENSISLNVDKCLK